MNWLDLWDLAVTMKKKEIKDKLRWNLMPTRSHTEWSGAEISLSPVTKATSVSRRDSSPEILHAKEGSLRSSLAILDSEGRAFVFCLAAGTQRGSFTLLLLLLTNAISLMLVYYKATTQWMKDVGTPAAQCGRNLTESERRLCKHSYLVSSLREWKGCWSVAVLLSCRQTRGADGKSLTTCACHRRRAAAAFFANALCGFCGIVFHFQQPHRKRSLPPVCLTAGYRHDTEGFVT